MMKKLYFIYNSDDQELISYLQWLKAFSSNYDRIFIVNHSTKVKIMMPDLLPYLTDNRLIVVDESGKVYLNQKAWILSLYSVKKYREWSYFFARSGNYNLIEGVALKLESSIYSIGELITQEINKTA